ncbi:sulfur carrier protein ThiS [Moraxella catarrhalis]|uniref:sulfur carrier protein ThiS n=1 Tax=Moraxella catarrhalis TaxID=480 RepID=UPI0007E4D0CB|nr:sulfur carrier protein ThiS [Moraxella catarrhalis]MPX28716.1 thiamine biosynthesis protein ThiS [Moraxella catarrhalis]RKL87768.1 sulfur carrier protein ThiS [Moraxella catarrhalis]RKL89143.1 sulfur carrier protein ThiS [Moraxella catarrhalis]RKL99948.1 sulfur carrier protein ThiS [Moraxella catarrhalis]
MKQVNLNGQSTQSDHSTVFELLNAYGLTQGRFAVEIDGTLVPKSRLTATELKDGMSIEVVQAVGGG